MGWPISLNPLRWLKQFEAVDVQMEIDDARSAEPVTHHVSHDPDWMAAKAYIRGKLAYNRRMLEQPGLPNSETEGHRYAILELEGVLNCLNPSKMAESDTG